MGKFLKFLTESKFKKGDKIRLKPDAEVHLSYKEGEPPSDIIKNELWIIDDVEADNLNISTVHPTSKHNAGSFCSWVSSDDVLEVMNENFGDKFIKKYEKLGITSYVSDSRRPNNG